MTTPSPTPTSATTLRSYLGSVAVSGVAFAMQQLLLAWLLIGVLGLPADRVGLLQATIGLPGVLLMLWGGARADRVDPRGLLVRVYALAALVPLVLALVETSGALSVWIVAVWGLAMSSVVSFSVPAQQAMLNRVAAGAVQKGVTAATSIGFLVQILGLSIAGQLDRLGLSRVLLIQAGCFAGAALLMRRLASEPAASTAAVDSGSVRRILEGLRATYENRTVFDVLALNFVSSIFNAGAFLTVLPFIVTRIYGGDAAMLSLMMVVFFAGATVTTLVMLRLMPFVHPGRWFVVMQLSRIAILFLLWIQPSWWLLAGAIVLWGLNMGVVTTLARAIVQESAAAEYRGRILSVFSLGILGSPLLGASILGWMIETFGTLNALIPGMLTSLLIFLYSLRFTTLWSYRSPE